MFPTVLFWFPCLGEPAPGLKSVPKSLRSPPPQQQQQYNNQQQFASQHQQYQQPSSSTASYGQPPATSSGTRSNGFPARKSPAATRPKTNAGRAMQSTGAEEDLHAKISQLTATVQMLSQAVLDPNSGRLPAVNSASNSARPGIAPVRRQSLTTSNASCRGCHQPSVAGAAFCMHCGTRQ